METGALEKCTFGTLEEGFWGAEFMTAKAIKEARLRRGLSQEGLARLVGISQGAIKKIEDGSTTRSKYLAKIASVLGLDLSTIDPSLRDVVSHPGSNGGSGSLRNLASQIRHDAATSLLGERDLPVYGTAAGGHGALVLSSDPFSFILRPHNLAGIVDAFAVLVVGSSMAREYREGDIAYCNPHLPPRVGDACLFQSDVNGTVEACIKYLEKPAESSDEFWYVSQANPEKKFTLPKAKWQTCYVLVGKQSGRS